MRALIQRVVSASVEVESKIIGQCGKGLLIYIGVHVEDNLSNAETLAKKIVGLRIFQDENGKMNLSFKETSDGPQVLVISNFTLFGQVEKGYRPSFMESAGFERGQELFNHFVSSLRSYEVQVSTGLFGADMKVYSVVEGPVNLIIDL